MSIVVAYQETTVGRLALQEAAKEAELRQTSLTVVNVPEGVDIDLVEATRVRLDSDIGDTLRADGQSSTPYALEVIPGEDAAEAVLDVVSRTEVELIVVGARRRSRVGKLLMGSVTQRIIMDASVPVLVVKTVKH